MKRSEKRGHILDTAERLFAQNGVFATGVDLIMEEASVSKRTLYKYFPSKEELILAVVQQYRDRAISNWNAIEALEVTPKEKIIAIFKSALTTFSNPTFNGCVIVNVYGECWGKHSEVEAACAAFKEYELKLLERLSKAHASDSYKSLAFKLFIILEGIFSVAQMSESTSKKAVLELVEETLSLR